MTPTQAVQQATLAGRRIQFEVSQHCLLRMRERNDLDGEELSVVVVFETSTIVVTVF